MARGMRRAINGTARGLLLSLVIAGSALVGGAARVPTVGLARAGPAVGARRWLNRRQAVALALDRLARDRGVEGPPAIVAGLSAASVAGLPAAAAPEPCSRGAPPARARCHLGRPTADIAAERTRRGWHVTVVLPELSDHVHRVTISTSARGVVRVEVDSRN